MSNEVLIITPEATPGAGGVADYALRVAKEWDDRTQVRLVVPQNGLLDDLPATNGKLFLHYSAYGFDRIGYPRALLRTLTKWKRAGRGRLILMLHEIWTFWPLLNKNRLVQKLHRADLRQLISAADAVFTSTPSQAEHLLKLVPTTAIQVLPVGSNFSPFSSTLLRDNGLAVIFGLQASRVKILRLMATELAALSQAKVITKLITCGRGGEADGEERALLSALQLALGFEIRGPLPEADVSRLLSSASFALSFQDALSLYKSGTFMAYAAHGVNIIAPSADTFAPEPICWLVHPAALLRGISPGELRSRAEKLQRWQKSISSWPHIAQQFAEALQI